MPESIRVAVVDDHPMMRDGIIHTLQTDTEIEIVGQGDSAACAIEIADTNAPEVMILDIDMPGDGLDAAREIHRKWQDIRLIILTVSESQKNIQAALDANARGYILKGIGGQELKRAVRLVHEGKRYFSPELVSIVLERQERDCLGQLTDRETEIVELIAAGLTNKEIGERLCLTEKTVKYYLTTVFRKLGVRNRVEAAMVLGANRNDS